MIIIIIVVLLLLAVVGYLAYELFLKPKGKEITTTISPNIRTFNPITTFRPMSTTQSSTAQSSTARSSTTRSSTTQSSTARSSTTFRPTTIRPTTTMQPTTTEPVYYGPYPKIWSDSDCNNLRNIDNYTLQNCKKECNNTQGCTAFNYQPETSACTLRGCSSGKEPSWNNPPYVGYSKYPTSQTSQQSKSWSVNWMPQTGFINMTIGNKIPFHLNIRDTLTVISSNNGNGWDANDIRLSQLHSAPRPLNLIISFNTSTGFTVNYQGQDIAVLPNRLNVTNANDLKIVTEQGITVNELQQSQTTTMQPTTTKQPTGYKVEDSKGIKNGNYKNISNNTFGLNSNLTNWTITIMINSSNYSGSWQSIVGNMYNNDLQVGWGLWVNPNSVLHWRIVDSTWDLDNLGKLIDNTPYKIVINFDNNSYKFTLTNLNTNISYSQTIQNQPKLEANKGFITLGGFWNNLTGEQFNGNINYLDFSTTTTIIYKVEDSIGIKNGNYKNISNNTFGLNSNLTNWTITIMINSSNYSGSWQSIVGNMYNNDLQVGWGLWVNPNSVLHWRIVDSTWDLDNLGKLIDNTPYKIVINFDNNSYKFTLTNLNTNISYSQTIQNQPKLEANKGFITLGGFWNNLTGEQFNGNINYLDFSTTII